MIEKLKVTLKMLPASQRTLWALRHMMVFLERKFIWPLSEQFYSFFLKGHHICLSFMGKMQIAKN